MSPAGHMGWPDGCYLSGINDTQICPVALQLAISPLMHCSVSPKPAANTWPPAHPCGCTFGRLQGGRGTEPHLQQGCDNNVQCGMRCHCSVAWQVKSDDGKTQRGTRLLLSSPGQWLASTAVTSTPSTRAIVPRGSSRRYDGCTPSRWRTCDHGGSNTSKRVGATVVEAPMQPGGMEVLTSRAVMGEQ